MLLLVDFSLQCDTLEIGVGAVPNALTELGLYCTSPWLQHVHADEPLEFPAGCGSSCNRKITFGSRLERIRDLLPEQRRVIVVRQRRLPATVRIIAAVRQLRPRVAPEERHHRDRGRWPQPRTPRP